MPLASCKSIQKLQEDALLTWWSDVFLRNGGSRIGVGRRGSLGRKKLCIKSIGWNRTFPQDFKVCYQSKVPTEAQGTRLLSEADTRTKAKKTFNLCVLSSSVSPHLKIVLRSTEEAQLGVRKEILWVWHAKGSPSAALRTLPCGRSARRSSPDVWCQRLIASISADSKSNISSWMALEALGCFISKAVLFGLEVCENRW